MKHVNRRTTKVTWIDPGKGHWGMHDGWGSWPEDRYHRVLGILFCKKHWTVPSSSYSEFACCYIFSCAKCAK